MILHDLARILAIDFKILCIKTTSKDVVFLWAAVIVSQSDIALARSMARRSIRLRRLIF
jgi:hypothetical protein